MKKRLRKYLSLVLSAVLMWTSGLHSARAWIASLPSEPVLAQSQNAMARPGSTADQGRQRHAMTAPQDRKCLLVCLDASPHLYLAAQLTRSAASEPSALYPFPPSPTAHWHERRDLVSIYQAPRGPPRSLVILSSESARTLLLLTARFRI
ncbi:MAG: hypothetical protein APF80_17345 [Alphaproteobacteria bacterium BRH_c36]|nr:MAG: hypothetical protein APF80_17345 [Alphaproteobacteria bacterium BRH_c36]